MSDAPPHLERVVILTSRGLEHHYVANVLCAAFPIDAIVVSEPPRPPLHRLRGYGPRTLVRKTVRGIRQGSVRDAKERRLALVRVLGEELTAGFHAADLVRPVPGVNSEACSRLVAELRPDLLLVYGTAIVDGRILELARDRALNMHTGISPYYRGADTWFWPLVNRELHMVGATVHECTGVVDGGPIFKTARAPLAPTRNMYDLFAWSVAAGAEIYVDVVRDHLADRARAKPQDLSLGREYRSAERTPVWNRAARRLIRAGSVDRYVASGMQPLGRSEAAGFHGE
jgi:hypothetical protein